MKPKIFKTLFTVLAAVGITQGGLLAQNTTFDTGDLILFFQKPGDNNTIYVGLGSAAELYRGSEAGPTADRQALNIVNINTALTTAYGAGWAADTGIYAGLAACRSSSTGKQIYQGDQSRTVYVSRPRSSVGTVGQRNSSIWDMTTVGNLTGSATSIVGSLSNDLETNHLTQVAISPVGSSKIDDTNPFSSPGIQDKAFTQFVGGVQQRGTASSFGTFGPAGEVEFALDLNRITPRLDSDTTGEVAGVRFKGSYEGTVVVGTDGNVSFITQGASSPFDSWIASFPTITLAADKLPGGDPDKDGATNLQEFAFGGDPTSGNDQGTLLSQTVDANGDTLRDITLTVEVRNGAVFAASGNDLVSGLADELTYRIEGSTNLATWDSQVSEVTPHLGTGSPTSGYEFKTFRLNAGNGLAGKGFLRASGVK